MEDLILVFLCILIFFILSNAFNHVLTMEKTYIKNIMKQSNIKQNKNITETNN